MVFLPKFRGGAFYYFSAENRRHFATSSFYFTNAQTPKPLNADFCPKKPYCGAKKTSSFQAGDTATDTAIGASANVNIGAASAAGTATDSGSGTGVGVAPAAGAVAGVDTSAGIKSEATSVAVTSLINAAKIELKSGDCVMQLFDNQHININMCYFVGVFTGLLGRFLARAQGKLPSAGDAKNCQPNTARTDIPSNGFNPSAIESNNTAPTQAPGEAPKNVGQKNALPPEWQVRLQNCNSRADGFQDGGRGSDSGAPLLNIKFISCRKIFQDFNPFSNQNFWRHYGYCG